MLKNLFPYTLACILSLSMGNFGKAQEISVIDNIYGRERISLNGEWKFLLDPMETGIKKRKYRRDFPADDVAKLNEGELIEYEWDSSWTIEVPGDWNSQFNELLWYEGLAWFRKKFEIQKEEGLKYFLYFEAVNYKSDVYLNGEKIGMHEGGFTPFQFEITDLLGEENSLVLSVDNKRTTDGIPSADFDWWNYGGITRSVWILKVPETYISEYSFNYDGQEISGYVELKGEEVAGQRIRIEIPELNVNEELISFGNGYAEFSLATDNIETWSPENPKLYPIVVSTEDDIVSEKVGFRTITTKETEILLNGESIFLRGICLHEEPVGEPKRTLSWETAEELLTQAKELNANFVRLAHYPHSEKMTRLADSLGLMVWSEIPVYWEDMDYQNEKTLQLARQMMVSNYERDKNRASVIIWSVANETPVIDHRNSFLKHLISTIREKDSSRLVTAALKVSHDGGTKTIDDPLGEYLDVLSINQYVGWYGTDYPDKITDVEWNSLYEKPMLLSEFGAGALAGNYGDKMTRWTEEFQEYFIDETMKMATSVPFLRGTMPWVLKDFKTPRRYHGEFQNYWNRKGLIDENGTRKKAFNSLLNWYNTIEESHEN
ncbi:MAG: hypothetical protein MI700_00540 [Balneolales bacterium]|nr:hypothetical protein [Balneolales bacterium]